MKPNTLANQMLTKKDIFLPEELGFTHHVLLL